MILPVVGIVVLILSVAFLIVVTFCFIKGATDDSKMASDMEQEQIVSRMKRKDMP